MPGITAVLGIIFQIVVLSPRTLSLFLSLSLSLSSLDYSCGWQWRERPFSKTVTLNNDRELDKHTVGAEPMGQRRLHRPSLSSFKPLHQQSLSYSLTYCTYPTHPLHQYNLLHLSHLSTTPVERLALIPPIYYTSPAYNE